jgi:iron(III) transport system substrate-binding protein
VTRLVVGAAYLLLACACGKPAATAREARPEPVVVYAAYTDHDYLPALFAGFTRETGIPVTLRYGGEQQNVRDVIGNLGSPPADVLLASTVQGIWLAADEGALRPLQSPKIEENVPEILRGPDDYWVATGVELAVIAVGPGSVEGISDYAELGDPALAGQLCLSTSADPVNRSVVAQLIAEHGTRPAEMIVRGWIRNLGRPAFANETRLLQAVATGSCALGLVSDAAARGAGLQVSIPTPAIAGIEAVGIARHARSPDAAKRLLEWLTATEAQQSHARGRGHVAANPRAAARPLPEIRHPAIAGAYDQDSMKLAERAAWR